MLETGETWGKEYQKTNSETAANLLQVGSWRPSDGPALKDELFPHIAHGFRGITLPLLTFHVIRNLNLIRFLLTLNNLQLTEPTMADYKDERKPFNRRIFRFGIRYS